MFKPFKIFNLFRSNAGSSGTLLPEVGLILTQNNRALLNENGGFLLQEDGISGIPSFNLANPINLHQLHEAGFL